MDLNKSDGLHQGPHSIKWELLSGDEESLAYVIFSELVNYENHYNIIQNKYKGLATTWFVATFIGIGYVLSGYETGISASIYLTTMFLCFISALGIFFLWFLDAGVYYKMIESIFSEIIHIEEKFPIVGSSHHNILSLHEIEHEPHAFHGIFYISLIIFLLSTSMLSLSIYLYQINFVYFIISTSFLGLGWILFIVLHKSAFFIHNK